MLYSNAEVELMLAELNSEGYSESDALAIIARQERAELENLDRYFINLQPARLCEFAEEQFDIEVDYI